MIAYQIDNAQLAAQLQRGLTLLQGLTTAYETGLYNTAKEAVQLVKRRAQAGASTDGEQLFTKSRAPIGAYGQRHGRARQTRGLQTAKVDLTFTGAMLSDFGISLLRPNLVEIGFTRASEAAKMEELEAYYGTEIMTVSDDEEEEALGKLEDTIFDVLDKLFS